jgi:UDP-N-acetylmuramate--alanine ligase
MGVGGVGMAAVAELEAAVGNTVSGCDGKASPTLARLEKLGVRVSVGHSPTHLKGVDRLVVSSAVKPSVPELAAALGADGLVVQHRSEALATLARGRRLVAVAGTHGKTTTAAMIVSALEALGLEPSYAIGSELSGRGSGARLGPSDVMVIEADESDESFLNYRPELAVVTNIEADHLDHYGTVEAYLAAFDRFAGLIQPGGVLIACAGDLGAAALMERVGSRPHGPQIIAYGLDGGWTDLGLAGQHMALNAEAAGLAALWLAGSSTGSTAGSLREVGGPEELTLVRRGLAAFAGTARRLERRGEAGGVAVFDDYAHHPTEITATLAAARAAAQSFVSGASTDDASSRQLLVVFQPHLYSRTEQFAAAFAAALSAADQVWLLDVYGAREQPRPGIDSGLIADQMDPDKVVWVRDRAALPQLVAAAARPGGIVLTMGAGDVTELGEPIITALEARPR